FALDTAAEPIDLRVVANEASGTSWTIRFDAGAAKSLGQAHGSLGTIELLGYCLQPLSAAALGEDPALGPANAPVPIIAYGGFGCPTCKAWHQAGILRHVLAKYGNKVRFVWRDFPIITADSFKAAEAGQCAQDQGRFWPFHDLVYDRSPAIGVDDLKRYAR